MTEDQKFVLSIYPTMICIEAPEDSVSMRYLKTISKKTKHYICVVDNTDKACGWTEKQCWKMMADNIKWAMLFKLEQ
jgi:hypothetical protein